MKLNDAQIAHFNQQGYLFFPSLLEADEVKVLQRAMPEILSRRGPEVIPEKNDPDSVRLAFGAHVYSEPFRYLPLRARVCWTRYANCWLMMYTSIRAVSTPNRGSEAVRRGSGIKTSHRGIASTG